MTEKGLAIVDQETGEIIEGASPPQQRSLAIDPRFVQDQQKSLALLQQLTKNVLIDGRDYGHIPGVPGKGLWDPGAQLILGAFNTHIGPRRILSLVNNDDKIAAVMEVPVISNLTGREVGSGVGASSTTEVKHKYRWVESPAEWGYDAEAAKTLKTKFEYGKTMYRIPNPEQAELLNVIIKQASKRAEVDAAQSLPGAASALREILDPKAKTAPPPPDFSGFWSFCSQLGLPEAEVHAILGIKSVKEWLDQGKTLPQAKDALAKHKAAQPGAVAGTPIPGQETGGGLALKRDPATLKSLADLLKACHADFGMQPADVVKELGYKSQTDIQETPSEAYLQVAATKS